MAKFIDNIIQRYKTHKKYKATIKQLEQYSTNINTDCFINYCLKIKNDLWTKQDYIECYDKSIQDLCRRENIDRKTAATLLIDIANCIRVLNNQETYD